MHSWASRCAALIQRIIASSTATAAVVVLLILGTAIVWVLLLMSLAGWRGCCYAI